MSSPPTSLRLARVFPSSKVLPENLLRIHLFFSEPPCVDPIPRAIRLVDRAGGEVPHPFLDLQEGLWDPTGARLTLILHPARIKSGLAAREAMGPAVRRGRTYRLKVDLGLLAGERASGRFVQTHDFDVGDPLVSAIRPMAWSVTPAPVGVLAPLRIAFNRPMDRLGLEQAFVVEGPSGGVVACDLSVASGEQAIRLTPRCLWGDGMHRLWVSPDLEDIAGNRIGSEFEKATGCISPSWEAPTVLVFEPDRRIGLVKGI